MQRSFRAPAGPISGRAVQRGPEGVLRQPCSGV